jgi:nucleotide-binding universal stress UspA family protein
MLPISRILVPVDLSVRSRGVLPYAKVIATQYNAQLTLMHVVSPFWVIPATAISGPALIPVSDSTVVEKTKQLEEWAPGQLEGIEVRRLVYEGDPVAQIVAFAASEDIDLVVISTHGYGVLRRFLIGSVAAKLLHDLACPVLTGVHLDESPRSEPVHVSKIVCAVDFGAQIRSTVSYASQLAQDFNAALTVVHVIPALALVDVQVSDEFRSNVIDKAREKLRDVVKEANAITANVHVQEGDIAEAVCSFAHSTGANLMVIGRGSQEGTIGRLRTNAYAIIRQSPCPVLSV